MPSVDSAVLANLNRIAAAINRASSEAQAGLDETLRKIVAGAVELMTGGSVNVAGAVTAVIFTFDPTTGTFDPRSRLVAGSLAAGAASEAPRPDGLGARALRQRSRVLSYEAGDLGLHQALAAAGAQVGVCYPLIVADQPVGALYVYLHEQRPFTELELLLLDNLVNLAAMAIHNLQQFERVQRNLERREDELARLRRADLLISSRLRLEETLEAILQMALEVTGARHGIFRLVDATGKLLLTRAIAGDDLGRPAVEALPINATSITGWVAKHRQPLCIADVRAGPWARLYYPLDHEREMRSELAVPLLAASGRLEGVINLESPHLGAFSEDDSLLLQSLATQAVIAIQDVRLLDALQELAERLLTQSLQEVFGRVVDLACELLDVPVSALWTLDEQDLVMQCASAGHVRGDRVPLLGSLTGEAIARRRWIFSDDVRADQRFVHTELAIRQGWTQALVVPLLAGDDSDPVGALSVYNTEAHPNQFAASDWDVKVLTFLAHNAALAVRSSAHQEALRLAREQRAAAETFAAVGDIAANLLHRLNNKIGAIPVRVEGIQDKCQEALAADEYLAANLEEIARSAGEAMEALSDSLFYLRPIQPAPVNIAASVAQALATTHVPPGISIRLIALDDLPPVIAGQQRLALVFVNLLENAVTAMDGAGIIRISGAVRGRWAEIRVSDNGPGIAPELHEKIFEFNFSGAKRSSKLGFGLWWVKTLIARFGGSITVESDGRRGATFTLRLPLAAGAV